MLRPTKSKEDSRDKSMNSKRLRKTALSASMAAARNTTTMLMSTKIMKLTVENALALVERTSLASTQTATASTMSTMLTKISREES